MDEALSNRMNDGFKDRKLVLYYKIVKQSFHGYLSA